MSEKTAMIIIVCLAILAVAVVVVEEILVP